MISLSIVVTAHESFGDLSNVMLGLERQTQLPRELIVAVMQHKPFNLPKMLFPVTQMRVAADPQLLAAARNAAAMAATGKVLVFLDQRCTPHPDLIQDYIRAASVFDGLVMGEVVFPSSGVTPADWNYLGMERTAEQLFPGRNLPVHGIELCEGSVSLSPLNCAIRRDTFMLVNGFEEQDGVENSKFDEKLNRAGIPVARIKGGIVYYS